MALGKGHLDREAHTGGLAADRLGFWSAAAITVIGIVYVVALGVLAAKGQLVMPPSQPVQLFGGVVTIVMAPLLVILFACVHQSTPDAPRAFASPISAVGFAAWGPVLDGITALLAVWFRRRLR